MIYFLPGFARPELENVDNPLDRLRCWDTWESWVSSFLHTNTIAAPNSVTVSIVRSGGLHRAILCVCDSQPFKATQQTVSSERDQPTNYIQEGVAYFYDLSVTEDNSDAHWDIFVPIFA